MLIQLYRAKAGSVSSAQSSGETETEEEDKTADRLWKMVGRRAAERDLEVAVINTGRKRKLEKKRRKTIRQFNFLNL